MLLLFLYFLILYLIKREIRLNNKRERTIFLLCAILSCLLAIPYRMYLIHQGYEYGLANFDMQLYVGMAEQIKDLGIRKSIATMSNNWSFSQINLLQIWGYRFYVFFLKYSIYKWTILSVEFSIYLVSIWQLLLASYSVLIVFNSIKKGYLKYNSISLFFMLTAPSIWYGCVRLLREVYMLYCIARMIQILCRKERYCALKIIIYTVILTIFRPYYTVFVFPLLLLLYGKEKLSLAIEGGIFIFLAIICVVKGIGPYNILGVVLSPNFYNQARNVWQNAFEVTARSGQIPFINFIGSIWNIVMIIYAILSLTISRNHSMRSWCSFGVILDICMLYAIVYRGTTELRHKIFFVIPFIIMLNNGGFSLSGNENNRSAGLSRKAFAINFCLGILLVLSILIIGLIP